MLTESWGPATLGARINAKTLKKQALHEILMEQGVRFGRVLQEIDAEAADPVKASLMDIAGDAMNTLSGGHIVHHLMS